MTATLTKLIDPRQAADRLGVSDRTIRRWVTEGRLRGYRTGPKLLQVDPEDVDRMRRVIAVPATRD